MTFSILAILATGLMATMHLSAFADHSEVTITTAPGNLSVPGCEETDEGCYTPSVQQQLMLAER